MPCDNILEELDKVLEIGEEKKTKRTRKTKTKEATKKSKPKKLTKKEQQIIELANNTILPDHYETVWTRKQLIELGEWIAEQEYLAIDTETMGTNPFMDEIVGISFYAPHRGFYIPIKHINDINVNEVLQAEKDAKGVSQVVGIDYVQCLPKREIAEVLKPLLENPNIKLLLHNSKFDAHVLHNWMGIDIMSQVYYDTLVGAKLLDENVSAALKDLATRYLKIPSDRFGKIFGKTTFDKAPILINPNTRTGNIATFYATKDTELTYKLWLFQKTFIEKPSLKEIKDLMFNIELPFLGILYKAEQKGIPFDTEYIMNTVKPALEVEVEELRQKIWAYTGEINLKAPAQVAEALYVKMELPSVNKDKPKCTDKKTLNKLAKIHEVAKYLLEFRAKSNLYDAFVS
jgi:DNA polymerase-1